MQELQGSGAARLSQYREIRCQAAQTGERGEQRDRNPAFTIHVHTQELVLTQVLRAEIVVHLVQNQLLHASHVHRVLCPVLHGIAVGHVHVIGHHRRHELVIFSAPVRDREIAKAKTGKSRLTARDYKLRGRRGHFGGAKQQGVKQKFSALRLAIVVAHARRASRRSD